jgi:tRNA G18 (ribose-2'-O)-methylase SpoU
VTAAVTPEPVLDPADGRLAPYRELKEARLARDGGLFIAESEVVVRKLLASPLRVHSLLVTPPRLAALAAVLDGSFPVYVASQAVIDAVAGFHVHRGCLAAAFRPEAKLPDPARTVLVLEDLVDVDNVGSLVRNAAALGADAVLLSPGCADAFYRKAVRTSAGHVFTLPVVRLRRWPEDLEALRSRFTLLGAVVDAGATPVASVQAADRVALVLGTEGTGLSAAARAACHELVTIPMAPSADSLNVAVAGAVLLYALAEARRCR